MRFDPEVWGLQSSTYRASVADVIDDSFICSISFFKHLPGTPQIFLHHGDSPGCIPCILDTFSRISYARHKQIIAQNSSAPLLPAYLCMMRV